MASCDTFIKLSHPPLHSVLFAFCSQTYKTLTVCISPPPVLTFCETVWSLIHHYGKQTTRFCFVKAEHKAFGSTVLIPVPLPAVRVITGYLIQGLTRAQTQSDSPHDTQPVLTLSQSVPLDV